MKSVKIFFWKIAACLPLLAACTESVFDNGADSSGGAAGTTAFTLSLAIEGLVTESATRATVDATDDEKKINTLTLFFFESRCDRSGMFVDWVELTDPTTGMPNHIATGGTSLTASEAYSVIGVANAANCMPTGWEDEWVGRSEAEFRSAALAQLTGSLLTDGIASNRLLMSGNAVKTAGSGLIDMQLTHNVARFDVENKTTAYTLVSARLRNVYTSTSVTGDFFPDYTAENSNDRSGSTAEMAAVDGEPIKGKLYAFENRSTSPSQGDRITTCLIVGLSNGSTTAYYRINIHPEGEGQYLRRNKAYAVCVTGVNGPGYSSPDEAYGGTKENELDYTINNWDLGANGLIVSDANSILALPVKEVRIGKDAVALTYTITTFSTLHTPQPLAIGETTALDAGLEVSLSGNTLTITADPLNAEQLREGSVTLTYAGLEATLSIVQSPETETYLRLSYETGWSGLLGPAGGEQTRAVWINASGSWKATIIGDKGFSFAPDEEVTEINGDNPKSAFTITAVSANTSHTTPRNAFVIVSLNDDPLHCARVVSISQAADSESGMVKQTGDKNL